MCNLKQGKKIMKKLLISITLLVSSGFSFARDREKSEQDWAKLKKFCEFFVHNDFFDKNYPCEQIEDYEDIVQELAKRGVLERDLSIESSMCAPPVPPAIYPKP